MLNLSKLLLLHFTNSIWDNFPISLMQMRGFVKDFSGSRVAVAQYLVAVLNVSGAFGGRIVAAQLDFLFFRERGAF